MPQRVRGYVETTPTQLGTCRVRRGVEGLEVSNSWSLDSLNSEIPIVAVPRNDPVTVRRRHGRTFERPDAGGELSLGLGLQGTAQSRQGFFD